MRTLSVLLVTQLSKCQNEQTPVTRQGHGGTVNSILICTRAGISLTVTAVQN